MDSHVEKGAALRNVAELIAEQEPRSIVLCFDGTSNEVVSTPTNILRICRCLVKDQKQLVYYAPGVGTLLDPYAITDFRKYLRKIWDLASGFSLRDEVIAGYAFAIRHYRPGDKVYVFGFSRGAYTARAVVGMLNMFGQLRPENENLIPYLWQCYRNNIPNRSSKVPFRQELFANAAKYKGLFAEGGPVPVEFAGLFDTVSSYLSVYIYMLGVLLWALLHWGLHLDALSFVPLWPFMLLLNLAILMRWLPYTASLPNARHVRHAVALDELRAYFPSNHIAGKNPDHIEAWFSGVHTDVGGGRREEVSQLAKVALRWMLGEAAALGLRFDTARAGEQLQGRDPLGPVGPSGNWIWLPAGLVPQLRLVVRNSSGRDNGQPRSSPQAAANDCEDKQESTPAHTPPQASSIRWYWPNFWRHRYIRRCDRMHASVAIRRAKGLLPHPRLSGVSWEELAKRIVYDKPLAGLAGEFGPDAPVQ